MAKGILSGIVWGAIGGTALLTVMSLYAPLVGGKQSSARQTAPGAVSPVEAPAADDAGTGALDTGPLDTGAVVQDVNQTTTQAATPSAEVSAPELAAPELTAPEATAPELAAPETTETETTAPELATPELAGTDANDDITAAIVPDTQPGGAAAPALTEAPLEQEADVNAPAVADDANEAVQTAPQTSSQAGTQIAAAPLSATLPATSPAQDSATQADDSSDRPVVATQSGDVEQNNAAQGNDARSAEDTPSNEQIASTGTGIQEAVKPRVIFPKFDDSPQDDSAQGDSSQGDGADGAAQIAAVDSAPQTQDAPNTIASDAPIVLAVPNTENRATGVVVNRLPSLRATPPEGATFQRVPVPQTVTPQTVTPQTVTPQIVTPQTATQGGSDAAGLGALQANAAVVEPTGATSSVAVILIDSGADGMDPAELTQLGLPFSIAIDPSQPDAVARAATYRAAGIEVLAVLNDLPVASSPSDVAVAMQGYFRLLPQAVAVLDPLDGRIQSSRDLLEPVLNAVAETGHGLVTYNRGLNTAQQTAKRQGVASATVFRLLDGDLEATPKIKRYLSRAAFTAAKDGSVVVVGRTYPETVQALVEWALQDKSADLGVVPVSQIMLDDLNG